MPIAGPSEIIRQIEALLALPFLEVTMVELESAHLQLDRMQRESERALNRRRQLAMVMFKPHDDTAQFYASLDLTRMHATAERMRLARGRATHRLIMRSFTETDQQRLRVLTRGPVRTDLEEQRGL